MNHNKRTTKILVWNIRGINSQAKWDALRSKIEESACQIVCLQKTKRNNFDPFFRKSFAPDTRTISASPLRLGLLEVL